MSTNRHAKSSTDELKETLSEIGSNVRELPSHATGAAAEVYDAVKETAAEYYTQGKKKLVGYEKSVEGYIREQPVKSVLIAAGVGLAIGILWKRR